MHFFGWVFWMAMFWFAFAALRRWSRWRMVGPRGYGAYRGRWDSREWNGPERTQVNKSKSPRVEDESSYIDALETRVSELEERLDFTERLLAGRQETSSP